jgi:hypothetical protein
MLQDYKFNGKEVFTGKLDREKLSTKMATQGSR